MDLIPETEDSSLFTLLLTRCGPSSTFRRVSAFGSRVILEKKSSKVSRDSTKRIEEEFN